MDTSHLIGWLQGWGFQLLQSVGIVSGLLFAALGFRQNTKVTLLAFRHDLMLSHRELWNRYTDSPRLQRVVSASADLKAQPISEAERQFVVSLVLHVEFVFSGARYGSYRIAPNDLLDIRETFAYPVVRAVWHEVKQYQDRKFVRFMEKKVLSGGHPSGP